MCLGPDLSKRPPRPPATKRARAAVNVMKMITTSTYINPTDNASNMKNNSYNNDINEFNSHNKKARRRVFFSPMVQVKRIPNLDDLTNDEKDAMYMNRNDFHRRVCFSPLVQVKRIPNLDDLTDDEKDAMYMNRNDFQRIQKEIAYYVESTTATTTMLQQKDNCFDTNVTNNNDVASHNGQQNSYNYIENFSIIRSLEMWVATNSHRKAKRWEIIQSILRCQSYANPEVTATIYRNFATPAVHEAHMIALWDEQQVKTC